MLESSDILSPINILVVEDDSFTRKLLENMFASMGHDITFAINGADGLAKFKTDDFDIVLSDYNMPEMNGLEMFREIREISPAAKLILMTIYTESDVLIKAINMGVDRFIEKPVYKVKLDDVISAMINDVRMSKDLVRYQDLLKSYRIGVDASTIFSILDSKGCYIYVNSNLCTISEYSEEELLGQHYDFIRKQQHTSDIQYMNTSDQDSEKIWQGCVVNVSKSHSEYITEVSLMPVKNGGVLTGFISIEKDMSFVVSSYIEQLQRVFNADDSIMFAVDSSMTLKICNRAFLDFFGYADLEDALEKVFCLFEHFADDTAENYYSNDCCAPDVMERFFSDVKSGTLQKLTLNKDSDGKELVFTMNTFMLNQSYLGLEWLRVIRLNDITELENLRKEELSSAMLASIGKLSAGITHEINTPLTYIKGNMELLQWDVEESVPEGTFKEMEEYFTSINDGIDRIGLIIDSMREVTSEARLEMEKINLYSTFIVAGRMIYNRAKHVSPIYINGQLLTLESDVNGEFFEMEGAPKMLEQLWIILLNNSLDQLTQSDFPFDEKYIKINIKMREGAGYLITIADNGGGFAPDIIGRLFDLFTSTKKHKGMGIGLNIAKNIIEKHNGTIKPYNSEDGAVFEILL